MPPTNNEDLQPNETRLGRKGVPVVPIVRATRPARAAGGRIGRCVRGSRGRVGFAAQSGGQHVPSQDSKHQPSVRGGSTRRASGSRIPYTGRGHTRGRFSQGMGPPAPSDAMPAATHSTSSPLSATPIPSKLVTLELPESCRKGFPMNKQNRRVWVQARKTALEVEWNMGIVSYVIKDNEVLFELRPRHDGRMTFNTSYTTPQTWATTPLSLTRAGPSYLAGASQKDATFQRSTATLHYVNGSQPDPTISSSVAIERPFVNAKSQKHTSKTDSQVGDPLLGIRTSDIDENVTHMHATDEASRRHVGLRTVHAVPHGFPVEARIETSRGAQSKIVHTPRSVHHGVSHSVPGELAALSSRSNSTPDGQPRADPHPRPPRHTCYSCRSGTLTIRIERPATD